MELADAELMQRFGAGDDEAFRQLVRRHEPGLLNYFWRQCFDRALAEDCAQEVFLRLVRHRGSWKPTAKFTTYLYRIARNLWIDRYRSRKAAPPTGSLHTRVGEGDGELVDTISAPVRRPEERAHDEELNVRIREAVESLTPEQRSVFVLAETKGLKYRDIAEVLDIPVGTVKSRMHAAVTRLRGLLKEVDSERP
jgi:RNA polymerase sigma-70 factor (ECF subfamily)